jgi:phage FluMu protein Com
MPIETICQKCARKLRVADEFAGRKARCPHCKNVYTVPLTPVAPSDDVTSPFETDAVSPLGTDAALGQPDSTTDQWRLRTEDGNVYGPVGKNEVDAWLSEGRITAGCQLQQDGSMEWTPASTVYPVLSKPTQANPFADQTSANANPYTAPTTSTSTRRRHQQPHRGGVILAIGVIGLCCCGLISPVAWVMGSTDLTQIRSGRMDPAGSGMTKAGMVLGIIGSILLVLRIVLAVISALN